MKLNRKTILGTVMAIIATAGLSSCDSLIYSGEGDCSMTYSVRLLYDYNMKWADATAAEVDSVNIFLYNTDDGTLAWRGSKSGADLAADEYTVTLPVGPGNYDIIAWASGHSNSGMSQIGGYTLVDVSDAEYEYIDNLEAILDHTEGADYSTSDLDLNRLFHGSLTAVNFPDSYGTYTVTVPLVKDTNVVRVMLQQNSGKAIDADEFIFTISDDNVVMNYDNAVITGHPVVYSPWAQYSGAATMAAKSYDGVNVVVAEMTTGRFIDGNKAILTVSRRSTGSTVLQIPLFDYVLMVKGYYNSSLSDQEYFDRKDDWNLTFFLDDNLDWITSSIMVESWRIVFQEME